MMHDMVVEAKAAAALDTVERQAWAAFRAARPELASPCFDLRFILAAARAAPAAEIAVIRRGGRIEGFLPFQRRGGLIQPLGAPLSDYHGPVSRPGVAIDLAAVVERLGARRFRFSGLMAAASRPAEAEARPAMIADLSAGYDAYLAGRRAAGHGRALKDKRRRARLLAAEHGDLSFTFCAGHAGLLEEIVAAKREQMLRTHQHDVFEADWTRAVLAELAAAGEGDFGLRFAVLRAGGRMVAAEVGLQSGSTYHLWFPVYERAFARYSPGALMTLESLRALAEAGVTRVDFGPAGEDYKRIFAEPGPLVFEGDVIVRSVVAPVRAAARHVLRRAPGLHRPLSAARRRIERRIDRILACEPSLGGRVDAAYRSLGRLGRRRPEIGLIAALALTGFGLSLLD